MNDEMDFNVLKAKLKIAYNNFYFLHVLSFFLVGLMLWLKRWEMAFIFFILFTPDIDDCAKYLRKIWTPMN